jgi:hypothetical protein
MSDAVARREGTVCPRVAKSLAEEFPAALDAVLPGALTAEEQQRLAAEFRAEMERREANERLEPPKREGEA